MRGQCLWQTRRGQAFAGGSRPGRLGDDDVIGHAFARPAGAFCTNAGCDQCHLQRGAAGRRRRCAGSLASAAKMAAPQTALYGTRATAAAAIVAMSMAAPTPAPGLPSMRWSCRTSLPLAVKGTKLVAAMSASRRKRAKSRLRSRARSERWPRQPNRRPAAPLMPPGSALFGRRAIRLQAVSRVTLQT